MNSPTRLSLFAARRITLRNPFTVNHLPLLAQLHRAASKSRRRMARRLIGKPARRLHRLMRTNPLMPSRGNFTIENAPSGRPCTLNARNTQFGALYLSEQEFIYEPEVTALIDLLLGPEDTFLDVGANWGFFSFLALSRPGYHGNVHAIEPFPSTFEDLECIHLETEWSERLTCHQFAVSDTTGTDQMSIGDDVHSGIARLGQTEGSIAVPTQKLDALNLAVVDLIKIDVEGHEDAALRGAERLISASTPTIILENWTEAASPQTTLAPLQRLESWGYKLFQPVWVRESEYGPFAVPAKSGPEQTIAKLGLATFEADQRYLFNAQLNVLACHESKLTWLQQKFAG